MDTQDMARAFFAHLRATMPYQPWYQVLSIEARRALWNATRAAERVQLAQIAANDARRRRRQAKRAAQHAICEATQIVQSAAQRGV